MFAKKKKKSQGSSAAAAVGMDAFPPTGRA